jgi:cell division initiation protein
MKLTPLDIHHKEFGHSLRGYNEEQVDAFLDEVADEFERLFKENIDLSERLEAAGERVRTYQAMEATLQNTMVAATRSAEEIGNKARAEAEMTVRDAELKAKEIIHNALQQKQKVANELIRIKQAEEEFRGRYRSLLESQMRTVTEISLPDDVNVLLGDTDSGQVGDVEVRPAAVAAPAPAPQAAPAAASAPAPQPAPQPAPRAAATEPPASGFVQSVTLGEVSSPDMEAGDVELVEPLEFELPGFDALGEREYDTDIEEID